MSGFRDDDLRTFPVPPREGRVRFVTEGQTRYSVTVECADLCQAYQYEVDVSKDPRVRTLRVGDLVEIQGMVRMKTSLRKRTGEPMERNLEYRHDPHDGSDRLEWIFFQLPVCIWRRMPPFDASCSLKELSSMAESFLRDWDGVSADSLQKLVQALDRDVEIFRSIMNEMRREERDMNAPVVSLTVDL